MTSLVSSAGAGRGAEADRAGMTRERGSLELLCVSPPDPLIRRRQDRRFLCDVGFARPPCDMARTHLLNSFTQCSWSDVPSVGTKSSLRARCSQRPAQGRHTLLSRARPYLLAVQVRSFDTQAGLYDCAWSECHPRQLVTAGAGDMIVPSLVFLCVQSIVDARSWGFKIAGAVVHRSNGPVTSALPSCRLPRDTPHTAPEKFSQHVHTWTFRRA